MSFVESIRSRRMLTLLVSGLITIFVAGAAQAATTRYYSELLTSNKTLIGPTDSRVVVDSTTDYSSSLFSIMMNGTTTSGGIGSGYVSSRTPVIYNHTFAPTAGVDQILSATLTVGVLDDQLFDRQESASIFVDDSFWARGWATVNMFSGDVTAALIAGATQDELRVAIFSASGDFNVYGSLFNVAYTTPPVGGGAGSGGGPGPSVPEPSAALLFVAGFVVVRHAARRTA